MSKRVQSHKTQTKAGIGKVYGRARGPLVWSEELNRKTTKKVIDAIAKKKEGK